MCVLGLVCARCDVVVWSGVGWGEVPAIGVVWTGTTVGEGAKSATTAQMKQTCTRGTQAQAFNAFKSPCDILTVQNLSQSTNNTKIALILQFCASGALVLENV